MKISRRDFFVKTVQGVVVVSLPAFLSSALESCRNPALSPAGSETLQTVQGTYSNGKVTIGK